MHIIEFTAEIKLSVQLESSRIMTQQELGKLVMESLAKMIRNIFVV